MAACCLAPLGEAFLPPLSSLPSFQAGNAPRLHHHHQQHHHQRQVSAPSSSRSIQWCPREGVVSECGVAPRRPSAGLTVLAAAQGFGKAAEPSPSSKKKGGKGAKKNGAASGPGVGGLEGVGSWEKEYKAYIDRTGQYLCSMSWEGHEKMGRGAIFANYDDARAGGKLNEADKFGGIPSMYVPLTEFKDMKAAGKKEEEHDLAQILKRVEVYRPESEFVVVFQAAGIMGADIVRPSVSPPEMAKYVVKSDGVSTMPRSSGDRGGSVIDV